MILHKNANDSNVRSLSFNDQLSTVNSKMCKVTSMNLIDRWTLFTQEQQTSSARNTVGQAIVSFEVRPGGLSRNFQINFPGNNQDILSTWIQIFNTAKSNASPFRATTSSYNNSITLIQVHDIVIQILFTDSGDLISTGISAGSYITIQPTFSIYEFIAWLQLWNSYFIADASLRNGIIQMSFPSGELHNGNFTINSSTQTNVFRSSRSHHMKLVLETYKPENISGGGTCAYIKQLDNFPMIINNNNQNIDIITSDPYGVPSLLFYDYSIMMNLQELSSEELHQLELAEANHYYSQYSLIINSSNAYDFFGSVAPTSTARSLFSFPLPQHCTEADLSSVIAIKKVGSSVEAFVQITIQEINDDGSISNQPVALTFPQSSPANTIYQLTLFWTQILGTNQNQTITVTASNFNGSTDLYELQKNIRITVTPIFDIGTWPSVNYPKVVYNAWVGLRGNYIPAYIGTTVSEIVGFCQVFLNEDDGSYYTPPIGNPSKYNPTPVNLYGSQNSLIQFTCSLQKRQLNVYNTDTYTADITNTQNSFGTWKISFEQPFSNSIPAECISPMETRQELLQTSCNVTVQPYVSGRNLLLLPLLLIDFVLQMKYNLKVPRNSDS
jgi:hypothetical protein